MRKSVLAVATAFVLLMACGPRGAPEAAPTVGRAAPAPPSAQASAPAAPTEVKYAFAPRLPMVPVYVAQEKGYFAEQALDVDFVPFLAGSNEMLVPMDVRSLQDQHDFWLAKGLIRKSIGDVNQLIDYSYLDAALAQLGTR
jgi:hypothetical protein